MIEFPSRKYSLIAKSEKVQRITPKKTHEIKKVTVDMCKICPRRHPEKNYQNIQILITNFADLFQSMWYSIHNNPA